MEPLKGFKQETAMVMISFLVLKYPSGGSVKEGIEDSKLSQRDPLGGYYRNPGDKFFGLRPSQWE